MASYARSGLPGERRRSCRDRKSTRLNSSHVKSSYGGFCLKKKNLPAHAALHRCLRQQLAFGALDLRLGDVDVVAGPEDCRVLMFFVFNDTATTEIYTLSLHDALPIFTSPRDLPSSSGYSPVWRPPSKRS